MNPGIYNLPNVVVGNTWDGVVITGLTFDDVPPTVDLARVQMTFSAEPQATPFVTLYSPGDITIVDAETWEVTVKPTVLNLQRGTYYYGITFTDVNDSIKTYLTGTLTLT